MSTRDERRPKPRASAGAADMPRRRCPGRRGIKIHRNYTVDEVARIRGVAKITVRRWIKGGLPALTDRKPTLILGEDFAQFLPGPRRLRGRPANFTNASVSSAEHRERPRGTWRNLCPSRPPQVIC